MKQFISTSCHDMKSVRHLLLLLALAASIITGWRLFVDNTTYVDVANPIELVDGIVSYQTMDDFKVWLAARSLSGTLTVDKKDESEWRPPFNHSTLTIEHFMSEGQPGRLDVRFFNNRLSEVEFEPENMGAYVEAVASRKKFSLSTNGKPAVYGDLRVFVSAYSVRWSDNRLDLEVVRWIERYAAMFVTPGREDEHLTRLTARVGRSVGVVSPCYSWKTRQIPNCSELRPG